VGTHFRVTEDMQLAIEVSVLAGIMPRTGHISLRILEHTRDARLSRYEYSTGTKCNVAVKTKALASMYTVSSHIIAKATEISLTDSAVRSDIH